MNSSFPELISSVSYSRLSIKQNSEIPLAFQARGATARRFGRFSRYARLSGSGRQAPLRRDMI